MGQIAPCEESIGRERGLKGEKRMASMVRWDRAKRQRKKKLRRNRGTTTVTEKTMTMTVGKDSEMGSEHKETMGGESYDEM